MNDHWLSDAEICTYIGIQRDAVYKFKRYEDASLEYTGINKHEGEEIGLYDTVISSNDYEESLTNIPVEV